VRYANAYLVSLSSGKHFSFHKISYPNNSDHSIL